MNWMPTILGGMPSMPQMPASPFGKTDKTDGSPQGLLSPRATEDPTYKPWEPIAGRLDVAFKNHPWYVRLLGFLGGILLLVYGIIEMKYLTDIPEGKTTTEKPTFTELMTDNPSALMLNLFFIIIGVVIMLHEIAWIFIFRGEACFTWLLKPFLTYFYFYHSLVSRTVFFIFVGTMALKFDSWVAKGFAITFLSLAFIFFLAKVIPWCLPARGPSKASEILPIQRIDGTYGACCPSCKTDLTWDGSTTVRNKAKPAKITSIPEVENERSYWDDDPWSVTKESGAATGGQSPGSLIASPKTKKTDKSPKNPFAEDPSGSRTPAASSKPPGSPSATEENPFKFF